MKANYEHVIISYFH